MASKALSDNACKAKNLALKAKTRAETNIALCSSIFGPGSPSATNVVLLCLFLMWLLLLSDFRFPKALSFLNRSQ